MPLFYHILLIINVLQIKNKCNREFLWIKEIIYLNSIILNKITI